MRLTSATWGRLSSWLRRAFPWDAFFTNGFWARGRRSGYARLMLFMVIEHFKDVAAIGERFQRRGRMLPDGVAFHASWVEPGGARCYQVMEAASAEALQPWIDAWGDLADFEIIPVLTSAEFWVTRGKRQT